MLKNWMARHAVHAGRVALLAPVPSGGGRRASERLCILVMSRSRLATTPTISRMRLRNWLAVGMVVAGAAQIADLLVAMPGGFEVLRVAVTSKVSVVAKLTVKVAAAG